MILRALLRYFSIKKTVETAQEETLVKQAVRKSAHKEMLWRIYKHTGNVEVYTNYKEAPKLATIEIKKSKRTFDKKLASNIKILVPFTQFEGDQLVHLG